MKQKFFHRMTAALCVLTLFLSLAPAAHAGETDISAPSKNINRNTYFSYSSQPTRSYLYANEKGGLTRVEYFGLDEVVVEEFDSSFHIQSRILLDKELDLWGGFYAGSQYNFLIFGQSNSQQSDSQEVIRVVKYDKSWKRLGQASVCGANTTIPFKAGSLRCAESGGMLYIHTCHEMYKSKDGKNHQANMKIAVRESDMKVTETGCNVSGYFGYVSHSFNQFILVGQDGSILTANHGDAYPRAMVIYKTTNKAGKEQTAASWDLGDSLGTVETDKFPGETGANETNARLGGFAETSSGYLLAYSQKSSSDPYQIKLAYIAKNDFKMVNGSTTGFVNNTFQTKQLTSYASEPYTSMGAPFLVPTSLSGGYVIWSRKTTDANGAEVLDRTVHFTTYDANGQTGKVYSVPGALSECQPIVFNGKVVWYVTNDAAPLFYILDANGLSSCPANGTPKAIMS